MQKQLFLIPGFIIVFSFLIQNIQAQQVVDIISSIIEEISENSEFADDIQNITDELNDLANSPVNLNSADEKDLRRVPFLNDFQVKSILYYREEYGLFLSVNELLLVPGIRPELFEKLIFFVSVSESEEKKSSSAHSTRIKQKLLVRSKYRFEVPSGFTSEIDSQRQFLGRNRYLMTRYELDAGRNFKTGFVAEQDPGEPLFSAHNKFQPDHLSGFLEYSQPEKGYRLIIGDYRAGFGQGLVSGRSFMSSKSNGVILPERNRITRSISTSESGHLRGIILEKETGRMIVSPFISHVKLDAAVKNSQDETAYFTSVNRTGLHRNQNEAMNRKTISQLMAGADVSYHLNNISLGIHGKRVRFSIPMEVHNYKPGIDPPTYLSDFHNVSFYYNASLPRTMIFGEWAVDQGGCSAILNGVTIQLHPLSTLSMVHRSYAPTYSSFNASGFGKTSTLRNEEGFFIGIELFPLPFLSLICYADHYSFPYLRSNLPAPSTGSDYMVNALISPKREYNFIIRYKVSNQYVKQTRGETGIDLQDRNKLSSWRFNSNYRISEKTILETRYEQTLNMEYPDLRTKGHYIGQKLILKSLPRGIDLYSSFGVFDVPDWKNRIYIYEHDLLYDFSIPVMYRTGSRFSVMAKGNLGNRLVFWVKYYITSYSNEVERGSGADRVVSRRDSGVRVQVGVRSER